MVSGWLAPVLLSCFASDSVVTLREVDGPVVPAAVPAPFGGGTGASLDLLDMLGQLLALPQPAPAPEWAEMLSHVLRRGSFEPGKGWWHASRRLRDWRWLRERYDADGNGRVEAAELRPSLRSLGAEFEELDRDLSGDISQVEIDPALSVAVSPPTAAVFSELDHDANDRISWAELSWFFQRADRTKRGSITREDLETVLGAALGRKASGEPTLPRSRMLKLFFSGELGSFHAGPGLGDLAPDFRLRPASGGPAVRLSDSRGKRPVVLVFGSFT